MKYFYDQNNQFMGFVSDDSTLENSIGFTEKSPFDANYFAGPYTYDPIKQDWTGLTEEQFNALPDTPTAPTEVDQLKAMVGNLVAENAKKDQVVESLQKMIGQSIADSAQKNKDIQDMKVLIANLAADKVTPNKEEK